MQSSLIESHWMTRTEAARWLGVSTITVDRKIDVVDDITASKPKPGRIRAIKMTDSGSIRVAKADVFRILPPVPDAQQASQPATPYVLRRVG